MEQQIRGSPFQSPYTKSKGISSKVSLYLENKANKRSLPPPQTPIVILSPHHPSSTKASANTSSAKLHDASPNAHSTLHTNKSEHKHLENTKQVYGFSSASRNYTPIHIREEGTLSRDKKFSHQPSRVAIALPEELNLEMTGNSIGDRRTLSSFLRGGRMKDQDPPQMITPLQPRYATLLHKVEEEEKQRAVCPTGGGVHSRRKEHGTGTNFFHKRARAGGKTASLY